MTTDILLLIVMHIACSDAAAEQNLTLSEVDECGANYHQMKLSFIPGVTPEDYQFLSPREKSAVSLSGFQAFHSWRQENPAILRQLEAVARGEAELPRDG